jgi:predicted metal-dependent peptidase
MTPAEVERMLIKARAQLLLTQPFFATLALRLVMEETVNVMVGGTPCPVAATDGVNLYYNPEGCAKLSMDEAKGLWAHESMHVAMLHQVRRQQRDPLRWNISCDEAVNHIVRDGGLSLPVGALNSPQFKDMTAEEIYRLLAQQEQDGNGKGKPGGNSPPGGLPGQGQPGQGKSGNGPQDWGLVLDAPPEAKATQEQEWRVAVQQAAQAARSCGKLPGGLDSLIASLRGPRSSWFDYLKRFVADVMVSDYSWSRPSRRSAALGVYLPSTIKEGIGHIDLAIDTSGSISDKELECFGSKFLALHEELKPELTRVIYFDAKVQRVDEFGAEDQPNFHIAGRGGTDFRPIFDWIQTSGREPKCLVVLTDLEAPFPQAPSFPTLWVSVNNKTAPFGDTVYMEV